MRRKVSISLAIKNFRNYGFTVDFMSDSEFIENVYHQQWEYITNEGFFTSQDFIY